MDMQEKEFEITDLKVKLANQIIARKESEKISKARIGEMN